MSRFDYSRSVATARRLIDRFGKDVVLNKRTKSGPRNAPVFDVVPHTLRAVDLDNAERDKQGTLTGQTERKLLIAGSALATPEKQDTVDIGSDTFNIRAVETLNPGDTVVLYTVFLVV